MARTNETRNYHQFNPVHAHNGKNPFTFDYGAMGAVPGAYATAKQWGEIGYRIIKGCTGAKVYSLDENGKAHAYTVFSQHQVRRTRKGITAEKLAEIIAETRLEGERKMAVQYRKFGIVWTPHDIIQAHAALEAVYNEQQPERERRKNDRIAEQIKAREEENERKNQPPENGSDFVDTDAASGGFLEIM